MNRYTLRFWTGPTQVDGWADRLEAAGIPVKIRGTEHIHVEAEGSEPNAAAHNVAVTYEGHYGTAFPLRTR